MNKLICSTLLIVFSTGSILGAWSIIPLSKLVDDADLIIVGTLHSAEENDRGVGAGYIRVEEMVSEDPETFEGVPLRIGDNLKIEWTDNWACAAGMHMQRLGKRGIWLLDVEMDGTVSAAYPGKFASLDKRVEIEQQLLSKKLKSLVKVDVNLPMVNTEYPSAVPVRLISMTRSSSSDAYSPGRAGITLILFTCLYFLLYRNRFRGR